MKAFADYHTHTTYSHGEGSIEDNVKVALAKGLRSIAISDHGPGHMGFGIKRAKYPEMRSIINELNEKYKDINVMLGLEANILGIDGKIDMYEEMYEHNDILLAGYHFGSSPSKFLDMRIHLMNVAKNTSKRIYSRAKDVNTISQINALEKYKIDVLTHPGSKGPIDLVEIAKVAARRGTALEVSNHHSKLSVEDLVLLRDSDVKFVVSSDAHTPGDVGSFDIAIGKLKEAGIHVSRVINCE